MKHLKSLSLMLALVLTMTLVLSEVRPLNDDQNLPIHITAEQTTSGSLDSFAITPVANQLALPTVQGDFLVIGNVRIPLVGVMAGIVATMLVGVFALLPGSGSSGNNQPDPSGKEPPPPPPTTTVPTTTVPTTTVPTTTVPTTTVPTTTVPTTTVPTTTVPTTTVPTTTVPTTTVPTTTVPTTTVPTSIMPDPGLPDVVPRGAFRAYLNEEQFDRGNDPDHVISATEMQDVTDVLYSSDWWEGESPSNLEGLQYATNLRTLAAYEIERLPDLSELPNLEWVHLEVSDGWEGFPTPVGVFPRLQTLEIGGEALRQLPDELFAGGALSILEIFDAMNFKMIPSSLTINESLVTLHLDETGIEVLPDFIGDISSLELLFLVDNPHLGALPDVFDGLPNLRSLLLWNNDSLVALPPSIGEATALTAIEIYGASFETVPESIGNLQYLQEFLISSPVLTPLPASINGLRSLWLLDITGPESFSLPAALSGMHSLEDLYLRDTGLTSVPEGISTLPALENLDVARNKLTVLPEFLVEMAAREVGALKHINAFDNPLDFTDPVVITLSESILHF